MSNQKDEFDVLRVIELARQNKYEITSAGFATLDKIDKIQSIPKKLKTRKHAVQALYALSEKLVKYDYFTPEEKKKLLQDAGLSDAPYKFKSIFGNSSAPAVEEDTEEDFIPEEEPKAPVIVSEDDDDFDSDIDEDDDDDDDDDDIEDDADDEDEEEED